MTRRWRILIGLATLAAALLLATGCSSDDDDAADDAPADIDTPTGADASDLGDDLGELAADADLVVPRDYLQGEWCDSDGQSWVIEGDNARWKDATGGSAEVPIGIVFGDGVGIELRSQTDDAFTFGAGGDEVTFTRGSC
jgi:hypothetical protein